MIEFDNYFLTFRYNQLGSLPDSLCHCELLEDFNIEGNNITCLPVRSSVSYFCILQYTYCTKAPTRRPIFLNFPLFLPQVICLRPLLNLHPSLQKFVVIR